MSFVVLLGKVTLTCIASVYHMLELRNQACHLVVYVIV